MIQEHQLTLTSASLVAALNYLGYLCSSFDAMRAHRRGRVTITGGRLGRGDPDAALGLRQRSLAARGDPLPDWLGSSHARLALVLWTQALGVLAAALLPGFSGLLVGGGFLSVVQLSLLYARELAPQHLRYMAGLLTTGYAVGPLLSFLSTALLHRLEPAFCGWRGPVWYGPACWSGAAAREKLSSPI